MPSSESSCSVVSGKDGCYLQAGAGGLLSDELDLLLTYSKNLLISPFKPTNPSRQVPGTSDASKTSRGR